MTTPITRRRLCSACGAEATNDDNGTPLPIRCLPGCSCRSCRQPGRAPDLPTDLAAQLRALSEREAGKNIPRERRLLLNATVVALIEAGWAYTAIARSCDSTVSVIHMRWRAGRSAIQLHQHHGGPKPPDPLPVPTPSR